MTLGGDPAQACAKWHCIVDENMALLQKCVLHFVLPSGNIENVGTVQSGVNITVKFTKSPSFLSKFCVLCTSLLPPPFIIPTSINIHQQVATLLIVMLCMCTKG